MNPLDWALAGITAVMIGGIGYYSYTVNTLESDIEELKIKLRYSELRSEVCIGTLDRQNIAIDQLEIDLNKATEELDAWRKSPAKVKYEKIYVRVPAEINATRSNCEDVGILLDVVKDMEINSW